MVLKRKPLPDVGELVIATVTRVFDYGAYVKLDEYRGYEAFLPWSEITTKHFKDIREVVRENQRIVARVIRIDRKKNPPSIDISSKRVRPDEQRSKVIEWKRAQKAHSILELIAQQTKKSIEEIYKEIGWKLEDKYKEILYGIEETVMRGPEAAIEAGVDKNLAEILYEIAKKHIEIKKVSIKGIITLRSLEPDGIDRIKDVLKAIYDTASNYSKKDLDKIEIYTIGAPRYRLELEGFDYKVLEKILTQVLNKAMEVANKRHVEISFERI
ncbi:MAG: translation initiation factor IF-2 subunit alpha [Sulfolobales archaeon]